VIDVALGATLAHGGFLDVSFITALVTSSSLPDISYSTESWLCLTCMSLVESLISGWMPSTRLPTTSISAEMTYPSTALTFLRCTMVGGSSDGVTDIIAVTLNLNTQSHGSMTTSTRRPAEQHHLSVEKGCQLATASDKFVNSYVGISHRTTTLQNHVMSMPAGSIMVKDFDFLKFGAGVTFQNGGTRIIETQEGGILQIIKDISPNSSSTP
jgi:hypothetical protein